VRVLIVAVTLLALSSVAPAASDDDLDERNLRAELLTLDGEVTRLEELPGEGGLAVLAVTIFNDEMRPRDVELLLAPAGAMLEAGVTVTLGDRLRVRAFPAEQGPLLVHRIWNLTHRGDARLRTLRRDPVWNGDGDWQGKGAAACPYLPPVVAEEAADAPPPR
jgi:hypothetical protein